MRLKAAHESSDEKYAAALIARQSERRMLDQ
jgi:hypothetical protein